MKYGKLIIKIIVLFALIATVIIGNEYFDKKFKEKKETTLYKTVVNFNNIVIGERLKIPYVFLAEGAHKITQALYENLKDEDKTFNISFFAHYGMNAFLIGIILIPIALPLLILAIFLLSLRDAGKIKKNTPKKVFLYIFLTVILFFIAPIILGWIMGFIELLISSPWGTIISILLITDFYWIGYDLSHMVKKSPIPTLKRWFIFLKESFLENFR